MAFEPMTQIITEIGKWGKKNGQKIVEAFSYESDWSAWAQVELALYFRDFDNVEVSRDQPINSQGIVADLLLKVQGGKNIAVKLVCETLPPGGGAQGEDTVYERIIDDYNKLKNIDTKNIRPVAAGIVVSNIANDNAKYNLCDKSLFDCLQLYASQTGAKVNLYFRWI